ncbi:MAG: sulfatase [Bacteroides sp. SM23_62_1]|nr:MAG: sulfatase [Bacteroides sp. SM23_62_1]
MKKPVFIILLSIVAFLYACQKQPERPNIIFIMSDDHAYQAISAYGSVINKTPNIDRLAQEGMIFQNAFVTNSICAPCRAVILTGKYSHLNGVLDNVLEFDTAQATFPKILQEAGYQTVMIGKWHLKSDPKGFDFWKVLPGQGNYYNPDFRTPEGRKQIEGYVTDIITDVALDWLKNSRDPDRPFMMMYHHKAPHREWWPGPDHLKTFDGVTFPEPPTLFDDYTNRGSAAREQEMTILHHMNPGSDLKIKPDDVDTIRPDDPWNINAYKWNYRRMTDEQRRQWDEAYDPMVEAFKSNPPEGDDLLKWKYQRYMHDYLSCIASVDDNVGRLLDYLDKSGLTENTIVVYTSDQGFYLGEHGWFDKRFMYEESFRTPLLIRWPGRTKPGSQCEKMVMNLDFAETFLDAAGLTPPEQMQGESLVPLLKGETTDTWRNALYYHYYEYPAVHMVKRHYGIRTERYKLIHFYYDIDEWELYDLQEDPHELNNLYGKEGYDEITADLKSRLNSLINQYGDSDELTRSFLPQEKE